MRVTIPTTGSRGDVLQRPRHPYTRALLSSIPRPDPRHRRLISAPLGEIPSAVDRPTGCHYHPRCPLAMPICAIEYPALELKAGLLDSLGRSAEAVRIRRHAETLAGGRPPEPAGEEVVTGVYLKPFGGNATLTLTAEPESPPAAIFLDHRAISALRPSGVVDFEGRRVDTVTEGMMVEPGQWVRCVDVQANRVVVRPVADTNPTDLLQAADTTLYRAKGDGKGRDAMFDRLASGDFDQTGPASTN